MNHRAIRRAWWLGAFAILATGTLPLISTAADKPAAGAATIKLTDAVRKKCLSVLSGAVQSDKPDDFWPGIHAAEGLTIGGEGRQVIANFGPKLKKETDDQRRCGLAREMVRAGDYSPLPVLHEILAKEDSYAHTHAAESLYKIAEIGDGQLMRRRLEEALDHPLRLMAAAALARCGNPAALEAIRDLARDPDAETRRSVSWCLGVLGDKSDYDALRKIVADAPDAMTKCFAEHALALLGDAAGQAALIKNLSSDDASVRTFAANFAGDARLADAAPRLEKLLDDENIDVRARAAQGLLTLALPAPPPRGEVIVRDVFAATEKNPRISEGSIVRRSDGSLLFAITEFAGSTSDFAGAHAIARESRDGGRNWSEPRELLKNEGKLNTGFVTLRYLAEPIRPDTPLGLFYLVTNSYQDLPVRLRISKDEGRKFGEPIAVSTVPGYHCMNNDRVVRLTSGRLLAPIASTDDVEKENHFVSWCSLSDDGGLTWRAGEGRVDWTQRGAMEPEVLELSDGRVLMIIRTQTGNIATAISDDGGNTWGKPSTLSVKSPESPATLRRIPATGDLLLIWNNSHEPGADHSGRRTPLTAAVSGDEGHSWKHIRNIEDKPDEQYAYTSLLFAGDRALLSYYVEDGKTKRISTRFRSIPVAWFYER